MEDHIFDASQSEQESDEARDEPKKKRSELDSLVPKALMRKKKKAIPKPVVDVDDGEEVEVDETTAVAAVVAP